MGNIKTFIRRFVPGWIRKIRQRSAYALTIKSYTRCVRSKMNGLVLRAGDIEILCVGSSHADYGFFPEVFQGTAFNFGCASQDLRTSSEILSKYLGMLENLKYVVLFFSVFTPGSCLAKNKEAYRAVVHENVLGIPLPAECRLNEKERKYVMKVSRSEPGVDECVNELGFNSSMPGFDIPAEERVRTHLRENLREPDQMSHLKEIISKTDAKNVRLLIVIPPVRADYRTELPSKEKLFKKLYSLQKRGGVRIVNFFDDADFGEGEFADTDHLNVSGAQMLSSKISEKLNAWTIQ